MQLWIGAGFTPAFSSEQKAKISPQSIRTRYASAIRTWRSTPSLQHSITPTLHHSITLSLHHSGVASILRTVVWEICCPEGTHRTLSRRDSMIVARQFIAWNTPKKRRTVPEGRCELGYTTYSPPMVEERPVDPIIPFPTGRVLCVAHSRQ